MRITAELLLAVCLAGCAARRTSPLVPSDLSSNAATALVYKNRAQFIFPTDTRTEWVWSDSAYLFEKYAWGAVVQGADTTWGPEAEVLRTRHPAPFRSLSNVVAAARANVYFNPGGHVLIEVPDTHMLRTIVQNRVIITLQGRDIVGRVFQSRPDSILMGFLGPTGPYRQQRVAVRYQD